MAKISLIVPVLNEVQKIDGFLNQLKGLPGDWEAIFADGGSTDGTTEKITAHYPVIHAPKGRARQMNEGAHHASGEVFLFLHCDSLIPQDLYAQVEEVIKQRLFLWLLSHPLLTVVIHGCAAVPFVLICVSDCVK